MVLDHVDSALHRGAAERNRNAAGDWLARLQQAGKVPAPLARLGRSFLFRLGLIFSRYFGS
jgi:hypothetical protein